jgi:hypothetical protein
MIARNYCTPKLRLERANISKPVRPLPVAAADSATVRLLIFRGGAVQGYWTLVAELCVCALGSLPRLRSRSYGSATLCFHSSLARFGHIHTGVRVPIVDVTLNVKWQPYTSKITISLDQLSVRIVGWCMWIV